MSVTVWRDVENLVSDMPPRRLRKLKGVIEQTICAYSRNFVATALSTFSSYAQRMRVYADAPQKERLTHTDTFPVKQQERIRGELAAWDAKGGARAFHPEDASLASLAWSLSVSQPDISQ